MAIDDRSEVSVCSIEEPTGEINHARKEFSFLSPATNQPLPVDQLNYWMLFFPTFPVFLLALFFLFSIG
jgi:hypothetical protein